MELISGQLDQLEPGTRLAAISECVRRLTARLHTEATKIQEALDSEK